MKTTVVSHSDTALEIPGALGRVKAVDDNSSRYSVEVFSQTEPELTSSVLPASSRVSVSVYRYVSIVLAGNSVEFTNLPTHLKNL